MSTLKELFDSGVCRYVWTYFSADEIPANWTDITPANGHRAITPLGAFYMYTNGAWTDQGGGGAHPNLATHDALGLATDTELSTHASDATSVHGIADTSALVVTTDGRLSDARTPVSHGDAAHAALTYEASGAVAAHAGAADPHTGYVKENDANWLDLTDAGQTSLHSHAGGGGLSTLKKTADQIINGTAFQNITDLTFPASANTDYAFDFYITFRSTTTTGFRFSVNGPAGVVDFMRKYQTVANNNLVGVATWLEGHSVAFDTMTVTTATIAAGVDLHCRMTGRFKCGGAGGTFAARAASESANNDLVVQKGSWGTYF